MTEESGDLVRQSDASTDGTSGQVGSRTCYLAAELFGEATEIIIELRDLEYRLRITSNGKLILTK